jgi:hypothetical protein
VLVAGLAFSGAAEAYFCPSGGTYDSSTATCTYTAKDSTLNTTWNLTTGNLTIIGNDSASDYEEYLSGFGIDYVGSGGTGLIQNSGSGLLTVGKQAIAFLADSSSSGSIVNSNTGTVKIGNDTMVAISFMARSDGSTARIENSGLGSLYVLGGTAYGASGIETMANEGTAKASLINSNGGSLTVQGGSASYARGILTVSEEATGLIQNSGSGVLNVLGGSGTNAYGIQYLANYSSASILNSKNGNLTLQGGTSATAHALYIVAYRSGSTGVVENAGSGNLKILGGTSSASNGIYYVASSGKGYVQNTNVGTLTIQGGSATNAYGINYLSLRAGGSVINSNSGKLQILGGSASGAYGINYAAYMSSGAGLISNQSSGTLQIIANTAAAINKATYTTISNLGTGVMELTASSSANAIVSGGSLINGSTSQSGSIMRLTGTSSYTAFNGDLTNYGQLYLASNSFGGTSFSNKSTGRVEAASTEFFQSTTATTTASVGPLIATSSSNYSGTATVRQSVYTWLSKWTDETVTMTWEDGGTLTFTDIAPDSVAAQAITSAFQSQYGTGTTLKFTGTETGSRTILDADYSAYASLDGEYTDDNTVTILGKKRTVNDTWTLQSGNLTIQGGSESSAYGIQYVASGTDASGSIVNVGSGDVLIVGGSASSACGILEVADGSTATGLIENASSGNLTIRGGSVANAAGISQVSVAKSGSIVNSSSGNLIIEGGSGGQGILFLAILRGTAAIKNTGSGLLSIRGGSSAKAYGIQSMAATSVSTGTISNLSDGTLQLIAGTAPAIYTAKYGVISNLGTGTMELIASNTAAAINSGGTLINGSSDQSNSVMKLTGTASGISAFYGDLTNYGQLYLTTNSFGGTSFSNKSTGRVEAASTEFFENTTVTTTENVGPLISTSSTIYSGTENALRNGYMWLSKWTDITVNMTWEDGGTLTLTDIAPDSNASQSITSAFQSLYGTGTTLKFTGTETGSDMGASTTTTDYSAYSALDGEYTGDNTVTIQSKNRTINDSWDLQSGNLKILADSAVGLFAVASSGNSGVLKNSGTSALSISGGSYNGIGHVAFGAGSTASVENTSSGEISVTGGSSGSAYGIFSLAYSGASGSLVNSNRGKISVNGGSTNNSIGIYFGAADGSSAKIENAGLGSMSIRSGSASSSHGIYALASGSGSLAILQNAAGAVMSIIGNASAGAYGIRTLAANGGSASVVNFGTLELGENAIGSFTDGTGQASIENHGTLTAEGTLSVRGNVINGESATLKADTVNLSEGSVLSNKGAMSLTALTGEGQILNSGTLVMTEASGSVVNSGTLIAERFTAGESIVLSGTMIVDDLMTYGSLKRATNSSLILGSAAKNAYFLEHLDEARAYVDAGGKVSQAVLNALAEQEAAGIAMASLEEDEEQDVSADSETKKEEAASEETKEVKAETENEEDTDKESKEAATAAVYTAESAEKTPERVLSREASLASDVYGLTARRAALYEDKAVFGKSGLWLSPDKEKSRFGSYRSDRFGFTVGGRYAFNEGATALGFAAFYSKGKLKGFAQNNVEGYGATLFGAQRFGAGFVAGTASVSRDKTKKQKSTGLSRLTATAASVSAKAGLALSNKYITFTPYAGVRGIYLSTARAESAQSVQAAAGAKVLTRIRVGDWKFQPEADVSYARQMKDRVLKLKYEDGNTSVFAGNNAVQGNLTASVTRRNVTATLRYTGAAGDKGYRSYTLGAEFGYRF